MHEDNKFLKFLYSVFLGILLALFVGIGINTFYQNEPRPEYPLATVQTSEKEPSAEQIEKDRKFEQSMREYDKRQLPYHRNVSIIALAAAVLLLVVSIVFGKQLKMLADGFMLGGLFTLLYSVGRSLAAQDNRYTFVAVTIGLLVVIYLGYRRFASQTTAVTPHK